MKVKQSNTRKKTCSRYCKRHKMYYVHECPYCEAQKYKLLGLKVKVVDLDE